MKMLAFFRPHLLLVLLATMGCATLPKADRDLLAAVEKDDSSGVDRSLAAGARLDASHERSCEGLPALGCAAWFGSVKSAQSLLARGADANVRGRGGVTPLHAAAFRGRVAVAELLIRRGAELNARNEEGVTPLFLAAKGDAPDVAELLLARGAEVDAQTRSGYTPLKVAAEQGNAETAAVLVRHGAAVDSRDAEGLTPLFYAASALLNRYMITAPGEASAEARARMGPSELARLRAALRTVKGAFSEVAILLVEHGANVNVGEGEHQPLRTAAIVGDKPLVEALLAHGAPINPGAGWSAESPLHAALAERNSEVAELLVARAPTSTRARTEDGRHSTSPSSTCRSGA
jgi:ankyrin repeat protein